MSIERTSKKLWKDWKEKRQDMEELRAFSRDEYGAILSYLLFYGKLKEEYTETDVTNRCIELLDSIGFMFED